MCCIPRHLSFRKLGSPISRFTHTLESPSLLDKTQGLPAKSRNPHKLCSDNHLKVKEIFFLDAFEAKGILNLQGKA